MILCVLGQRQTVHLNQWRHYAGCDTAFVSALLLLKKKKRPMNKTTDKPATDCFTCKRWLAPLPEQQDHPRGFLSQVKLMMLLSASPPDPIPTVGTSWSTLARPGGRQSVPRLQETP